MSMKNPLTRAGIEPATFRFVAQHLNHCATNTREIKSRRMRWVGRVARMEGEETEYGVLVW